MIPAGMFRNIGSAGAANLLRNRTLMGGLGGGGGLLNLLPAVFKLFGFKGGVVAVLAIGAYALMSGNLGSMLGGGGQDNLSEYEGGPVKQSAEEKTLVDFVSVVLGDTEETWHQLFKRWEESMRSRTWCCFVALPRRPAVSVRRRWALSTVLVTTRSTSISLFTAT